MNRFSLGFSGGPFWLLVILLVAGTGLAIWTYQHTIPATTRSRRNLLIALRSLGIALLLFAVFQPVFSSVNSRDVKPSIALVLDNSQSMLLSEGVPSKGSDSGETRRTAMLRSVRDLFPKEILQDKNRVECYTVGEKTQPLATGNLGVLDSLKAKASVTDLASVFGTVREAKKNENIEAIVLYSDGAYTAGASPLYAASDLDVPVYAVGLGDSSEVRDVAVTELFTNEVATVGVPQPVDVTIHAAGATSGERVTVGLYAESDKLDEQSISLVAGSSDQTLHFSFKPDKEGVVKLAAKVSTIPGEITEKNNIRLQYVNVLKNKLKVAIFSGAPSSDLSFIKAYYQNNPSVDLQTFAEKRGADFYGTAPSAAKLVDIDLVVLVGFPLTSTSDESIGVVRDLVIRGSKPLLFVPTRELDIKKLAELSDALPFNADHLRPSTNEIKVGGLLKKGQEDDPILRIPPQESGAFQWDDVAPLFKTETHFEPKPESQVLLEAAMQGMNLGEPLLLSRRAGQSRVIAFTGYGLWQWKLTTYGREQAFLYETHSHDSTKLASLSPLDILLGNASRWLTTREDNKRVRIEPERKFYEAGESIRFTGEVYDESFLPIENAEVTAQISGSSLSKPLELTLEPLGNGRYAASIPEGLAAGDYTYSGTATLDGKVVGTDHGRFNAGEFNVEFAEPRMRSDILGALASRTGGKFYTPQSASNLLHDIESSRLFATHRIENTHEFELWNAWPLLVAALCCFSAEWLIRKRSGML